ncbi:MAG TPA: hypothetical protein VIL88_02995 [Devosia sp.]|uniref:dioxygenase family protein n=1 Tax=Devosia sp. TaxID=1871048 RepID=UPI002F944DB5
MAETLHHDEHNDHDLGLAHDLPRLLGRRRLLALLGGAGLLSLSGLPAAALDCVALPWETAGPYPADGSNTSGGQLVNALTQEGIIRTDLRPSFGRLTGTAEGLQLELDLTLVDANGCTPLPGHVIYLWHCDTSGRYSIYDLPSANYLRGVGEADAEGHVRFTTIFPGCYDGRWPHMHFEIFSSIDAAVAGDAAVLTAQIALPEQAAAAVYAADARYGGGTANLSRITLATDNVFRDNSETQIAQQTLALSGSPTNGFTGTLTIPIDFTAERSPALAMPPPGEPDRRRPGRPPGE